MLEINEFISITNFLSSIKIRIQDLQNSDSHEFI